MDKSKGLYYNSFAILKQNVTRMIAVTICLLSFVMFFYVGQELCYLLFDIEMLQENGRLNLSAKNILFSAACFVVVNIISTPFEMGIRKWFYSACVDQDRPFLLIFDCFKDFHAFLRSLWLKIQLFCRKMFWNILFLLPAIVLILLIQLPVWHDGILMGTLHGMLLILSVPAVLGGLLCAFYFNLKYFLVYFLWFENPDKPVQELIRLSREKMGKNRRRAFQIYILLVPLLLCCVIVIPVIVLIPMYYLLTTLRGVEILSLEQK